MVANLHGYGLRNCEPEEEIMATQANKMAQGKTKVLVTGAAGCVGCQLVDELLRAGYYVVAIDRPSAALPDPLPGSLDIHRLDLTDAQAAFEIALGVNVVVNLAAIVDITMPFDKLAPVNLDAVQWLYQGATAGQATLFVHFSTGSLYRSADHPLREDDPLQASNDYTRTKLLSEDFVLSRDPTRGPAVNVIRPALIFGPRGKVLISPLMTLAPLLSRFTKRVVRLRGGPRTNLVHSFDVARAVRFLIEHRQEHGEIFNVANDDSRPAGEQISTMLEIAGMRVTRWSIPLALPLVRYLRLFIDHDIVFDALNGALGKLWDRVRKQEGLVSDGVTPRVDRQSLVYMLGDFVLDNSKLKTLGFEYQYPDLESGWRHTLAWYRENRWIPAVDPG